MIVFTSRSKVSNKHEYLKSLDCYNDSYLFICIGEEFNFCAILDDYELGKTLGVGGFGKVVLGKHREKKNEVAIKFTDVGDQLSSANLIQQIYKEAESLKAL